MASPLPLRPSIDHTPRSQSVTTLDEDNSAAVLESLASETPREIITALSAGPATASDLADQVNTSLQNTNYHLKKLRDAGIVTTVGSWYSSRGAEMTVYALSTEQIVIQFCSD